jgi:hypothetical protein
MTKVAKKQRRQYAGSMLMVAAFGAIQVLTLSNGFSWPALLSIVLSATALVLYVGGLIDLKKHGDESAKYIFVRRWLLAGYIGALVIIYNIF